MQKIAIVTDSNSGITQAQSKQLGVWVLPMPFYINDELFLEDITLTQEQFYDYLAQGADVKTSQPAPGDVTELWDTLLKDYDAVVHIPMSSGLSSSCQTAQILADDYDGRVQVVNNQRISATQLQSVMDAKTMAEKGWTAVEIKEELERYSIIRTVSAVERADVVVLLIDATEGVTEQDAKIAGIAHERGKGMIIAVNKWDALEKDDKTIYRFTEKVRNTLAYMPYAELLFISAKTGQRLPKLFETIDMVLQYQNLRVQTGVLNEILTEAMAMQQPPSDRGKRLKIYYMTQVSVKPPTFVIFVNDKELMHFSYVRYLENKIRESFGFRGTPLKFIIRERKEKEQ